MQSGYFGLDNEYHSEDELLLPTIQPSLLKLEETIYEIEIEHPESENKILKVVNSGTYDGGKILSVRISSTCSPQIKRKAFRDITRYCVSALHANVPRLVGCSNPAVLDEFPFLLINQSPGIDHEEFLRLNGSTKALITFLEGVRRGSQFIYIQGVKHRDCIKVLPSGKAVVYPPGILRSKFSGHNSTKRYSRLLLRDAKHLNSVLPLEAIYEVLCAADTASQTKAIEQALVDADSVTELALWNLADSLELPITRELHYHGPKPDFTLAVGDLGRIEPSPLAQDLIGANALIPFENWYHAVPTDGRERKEFRVTSTQWQGHLCSRAMRVDAATPYFLDCDFPLSLESTRGWVRYDDVLKKVEGNQTNMCLLYNTREEKRSLHAPDSCLADGTSEPLFTVRTICVRLRFDIPDPTPLPRPMYFHRKPDPNSLPHEYWGFISDHEDPLTTPSPEVQELRFKYEMHIQTTMQGDSWNARAAASVDEKISRLPGAFVA